MGRGPKGGGRARAGVEGDSWGGNGGILGPPQGGPPGEKRPVGGRFQTLPREGGGRGAVDRLNRSKDDCRLLIEEPRAPQNDPQGERNFAGKGRRRFDSGERSGAGNSRCGGGTKEEKGGEGKAPFFAGKNPNPGGGNQVVCSGGGGPDPPENFFASGEGVPVFSPPRDPGEAPPTEGGQAQGGGGGNRSRGRGARGGKKKPEGGGTQKTDRLAGVKISSSGVVPRRFYPHGGTRGIFAPRFFFIC